MKTCEELKNTWVKDKELGFDAKSQGGNFMPKKAFQKTLLSEKSTVCTTKKTSWCMRIQATAAQLAI